MKICNKCMAVMDKADLEDELTPCCNECGGYEYYDTDGLTRDNISAYLKQNGWILSSTERHFRESAHVWTKKKYDYLLTLMWRFRLDTNDARLVELEQYQRAVFRVADSENISLIEAANKIKGMSNQGAQS